MKRPKLEKLCLKYKLSKVGKKSVLIDRLLQEKEKFSNTDKVATVVKQLDTLIERPKRSKRKRSSQGSATSKKSGKLSKSVPMQEIPSSTQFSAVEIESIVVSDGSPSSPAPKVRKIRKGSTANTSDSDIILTPIDAVNKEQLATSIKACSLPTAWWDDNIINSFMHILHLKFGENFALFDCFLLQGRSAKTSVSQFLDSGKLSLFFPYNIDNIHWTLVVVSENKATVFDSLSFSLGSVTETVLQKKLSLHFKHSLAISFRNLGHQTDYYNCGPFSMLYAILYILDSDFPRVSLKFTKETISHIRSLMIEDVKSLSAPDVVPTFHSIDFIEKYYGNFSVTFSAKLPVMEIPTENKVETSSSKKETTHRRSTRRKFERNFFSSSKFNKKT
jgi:hypothetical protein